MAQVLPNPFPHKLSSATAPLYPTETSPLGPLLVRLLRFSGDIDLSALLKLSWTEITAQSDLPIWADQNGPRDVHVLAEGLAHDFSFFPNGSRHIFDFFGPGAICNWTRSRRRVDTGNILFKRKSRIVTLNRAEFDGLLADTPGLASLIAKHEAARAMRLSQRVKALIRLSALDRLRILLLDLQDEFQASGEDIPGTCPLNQADIADVIGVTSVHVSRLIKQLKDFGEIRPERSSWLLAFPEKTAKDLGHASNFSAHGE